MKEGFRFYSIGAIASMGVTAVIFAIIRLSEILPPKNNLIAFLLSLLGGLIVWGTGYYYTKKDASYKKLTDTYDSKADRDVVDKQFDKVREDIQYLNKHKANDADIENIKFLIKELGSNYAQNQSEHIELNKSIRESYEKTQQSIKGIYEILLQNAEQSKKLKRTRKVRTQ